MSSLSIRLFATVGVVLALTACKRLPVSSETTTKPVNDDIDHTETLVKLCSDGSFVYRGIASGKLFVYQSKEVVYLDDGVTAKNFCQGKVSKE